MKNPSVDDGHRDGRHDFDFLDGTFAVHNRRLKERLKGATEWVEFEATNVARTLLDGLGNEDEYRTEFWPHFVGMAFRFFDPTTKLWAIYWADGRRGILEPPVYGAFSGGRGVFEGDDTFEGRPIRVRFIWSGVTTATPRWEQAFSADGGTTWETNWTMDFRRPAVAPAATPPKAASTLATVEHLGSFGVVELRRYTIARGGREEFARRFESYFPEAFEQLGALAFGQFFERAQDDHFTWLRGFHDLDARARVNGEFYYGPLWKEHKAALNALIVDSDDVLLLRPLRPETGVAVLPALDVVAEREGARGIVVAQIFRLRSDAVEGFLDEAENAFAGYRDRGARPAGVLVTLDVPNNFPQLPVRGDGPYVVWLGVLPDEAALRAFQPAAADVARRLAAGGGLQAEPELVVLDPTPRSRLRWR